jgi:hypothetical protein
MFAVDQMQHSTAHGQLFDRVVGGTFRRGIEFNLQFGNTEARRINEIVQFHDLAFSAAQRSKTCTTSNLARRADTFAARVIVFTQRLSYRQDFGTVINSSLIGWPTGHPVTISLPVPSTKINRTPPTNYVGKRDKHRPARRVSGYTLCLINPMLMPPARQAFVSVRQLARRVLPFPAILWDSV